MYICQTGSENNEHFFLHCPRHSNNRRDLLDHISSADDIDLGSLSLTVLCNLLLFGDSRFCLDTNRFIVNTILCKINLTFQADLDEPNCSHLQRLHFLVFCFSVYCSCFPFLFMFTVYFFSLDYSPM